MPPINSKLLPETARITDGGQIAVGGRRLLELAERFGTPLFVYDEEHITNRCQEVMDNSLGASVYATKAFLCQALVKLIDRTGLGFDFSTAGEMATILTAEANPAKLVFHGSNKSQDELQAALKAGIGRIVVDSFDEMDRLETIFECHKRPIRILIRITPGARTDSHDHVQTGVNDSKFGFTVETGLADQAIKRALSSPAFDLLGLHAHIASQILDLGDFKQIAERIIRIAKPYDLPELSLGGGLGINHNSSETAPSITEWLQTIKQVALANKFDKPIGIEPGRSIVGRAGLTLYTVGTIKRLEGARTYVSVNGGMSDNIRPALYGSHYEAFLPRGGQADRPQAVRVVGHHCESGDIVVENGYLPEDLKIGDVLAVPATGAYSYSMASNYNQTPKPAIVFVKDGRARLVRKRETLDDLNKLDIA